MQMPSGVRLGVDWGTAPAARDGESREAGAGAGAGPQRKRGADSVVQFLLGRSRSGYLKGRTADKMTPHYLTTTQNLMHKRSPFGAAVGNNAESERPAPAPMFSFRPEASKSTGNLVLGGSAAGGSTAYSPAGTLGLVGRDRLNNGPLIFQYLPEPHSGNASTSSLLSGGSASASASSSSASSASVSPSPSVGNLATANNVQGRRVRGVSPSPLKPVISQVRRSASSIGSAYFGCSFEESSSSSPRASASPAPAPASVSPTPTSFAPTSSGHSTSSSYSDSTQEDDSAEFSEPSLPGGIRFRKRWKAEYSKAQISCISLVHDANLHWSVLFKCADRRTRATAYLVSFDMRHVASRKRKVPSSNPSPIESGGSGGSADSFESTKGQLFIDAREQVWSASADDIWYDIRTPVDALVRLVLKHRLEAYTFADGAGAGSDHWCKALIWHLEGCPRALGASPVLQKVVERIAEGEKGRLKERVEKLRERALASGGEVEAAGSLSGRGLDGKDTGGKEERRARRHGMRLERPLSVVEVGKFWAYPGGILPGCPF